MKPQICICCGEVMSEHTSALSRNPNLCASCSSLADGDEAGALLPDVKLPFPPPEPPQRRPGERVPQRVRFTR
jgi:hypothetical protein